MVGSVLGTGDRGRVMAYWWAIGTTGISIPARRPISWLYIPVAMTTISQSIRPRSVTTPVTWRRPDRSTTSIPVTLVVVAISTPRALAPAASAIVRSEGLSCPSVGRCAAPRTRAGSNSSWNSSVARAVLTNSSGRSNVAAHPAWRRSSSRRAGDDARRSEPTSFHPGS